MMVQILAYGQSDYVRQFGMLVDTSKLVEVNSRVLEPPKLKYGAGSKVPTIVSLSLCCMI